MKLKYLIIICFSFLIFGCASNNEMTQNSNNNTSLKYIDDFLEDQSHKSDSEFKIKFLSYEEHKSNENSVQKSLEIMNHNTFMTRKDSLINKEQIFSISASNGIFRPNENNENSYIFQSGEVIPYIEDIKDKKEDNGNVVTEPVVKNAESLLSLIVKISNSNNENIGMLKLFSKKLESFEKVFINDIDFVEIPKFLNEKIEVDFKFKDTVYLYKVYQYKDYNQVYLIKIFK